MKARLNEARQLLREPTPAPPRAVHAVFASLAAAAASAFCAAAVILGPPVPGEPVTNDDLTAAARAQPVA